MFLESFLQLLKLKCMTVEKKALSSRGVETKIKPPLTCLRGEYENMLSERVFTRSRFYWFIGSLVQLKPLTALRVPSIKFLFLYFNVLYFSERSGRLYTGYICFIKLIHHENIKDATTQDKFNRYFNKFSSIRFLSSSLIPRSTQVSRASR